MADRKRKAPVSWAGSKYEPVDYAADIAKAFKPDAPMLIKGDRIEDAAIKVDMPEKLRQGLKGGLKQIGVGKTLDYY